MTPFVSFSRRAFIGGLVATGGSLALGQTPKTVPKPVISSPTNPFVYRFKIGEFDAWSISDGQLLFRKTLDLMRPPAARTAMRRWLDAHGEMSDDLQIDINILLVRIGRELVLFDAGNGARNQPKNGWLLEGLRQAGFAPEQVTAGFLSHAHSDHLNGFTTGDQPTFPNAAFHFLPDEYAFWHAAEPDFSQSERNKAPLPGMIANVRRQFAILRSVSVPVAPGTSFFNGAVTIEAAPGHTAGHAIFRIRSGTDTLLHLADLAHHQGLMFENPAWFISLDHHGPEAVATRKKVFHHAATERTRCYGFHLPWPALGRIVPAGEGYLWHPEPWAWPA